MIFFIPIATPLRTPIEFTTYSISPIQISELTIMTTLAALAHRNTPVSFNEVNAVLTTAIGPQNALAAWCILAPLAISIWAPDIRILMDNFNDADKLQFIKTYAEHVVPNLDLLGHIKDRDIMLEAWDICIEKHATADQKPSPKKLASTIGYLSKDLNTRYQLIRRYVKIIPLEYNAEIVELFPENKQDKILDLMTNVPSEAAAAAQSAHTAWLARPIAPAAAAETPKIVAVMRAEPASRCKLHIAPNQIKHPAIFAAINERYEYRHGGARTVNSGGAISSNTQTRNGITTGYTSFAPRKNILTLNGVSVDISTMEPTVTYTLTPESRVVLRRDGILQVDGKLNNDTLRGGI